MGHADKRGSRYTRPASQPRDRRRQGLFARFIGAVTIVHFPAIPLATSALIAVVMPGMLGVAAKRLRVEWLRETQHHSIFSHFSSRQWNIITHLTAGR
ncbi:hypothetical protein [Qipengyuania sp.]|uniref:hypothetical protein n=1 Tax=Qipengyuania sp. TaxID=2004515 RepID=UPI003AF8618E